MKIVQLTTVHRWDDVRIYRKISRSLASAGHEVHLVAPDGNGEPDDMTLHSLPQTGSRMSRLLNSVRAIGVVRGIRPDVVHFHDPELMPAAALLRVLGYRIVYDVHEDLPRDIRQKVWIPSVVRRPLSWMASGVEWMFTRLFATAVVSVTENICRRFPARRTTLLRNFPILNELNVGDRHEGSPRNLMIYVGGLSADRGILELIEATRIARDRGHELHLELIGRPDSAGFARTIERAIAGAPVKCRGHVDRHVVRGRLEAACASMVLLHPTPTYLESLPVKLFEAMSAGVPVIASDFPQWSSYVSGERCGIMVDPENPEKIAEAMIALVNDPSETAAMGQRGRTAAEERYNWESESMRLLELYACLEKNTPVA